jgi:cytochrome c peroxidase
MGMTGSETVIVERLAADPVYVALFAEAFDDGAIDLDNVRYALASFVRSLVSYESPFDAFIQGDTAAISPSAQRGSELFYSTRLACGSCHVGFAFTSATRSAVSTGRQLTPFHNVGLYNLGADGDYPGEAQGLIEETGLARDMGRFRVPTLRNVELSAPYMHDGSGATLEDVIAIDEAGGRNVEEGRYAGDGRDNPHRSADLPSFELDDAERDDLLAFLRSLTDDSFTADPRHASPW